MPSDRTQSLCFHISGSNDPEEDMIVFAKTSIEAKRRWANEHGDGDQYITGISARRCKGWDQYAPGPVPALVMIEDGWYFECEGCSRMINEDAISHGLDEDDEGGPAPPMQPYEPTPWRIWCSRECHDDDMAERRRIKRAEARAIAVVQRHVLKRYPNVTLRTGDYAHYASVRREIRAGRRLLVHDVRIGFELPGMKHGALVWSVSDEKWRHATVDLIGPVLPWGCDSRRVPAPFCDRQRVSTLTCSKGDLPVWEAYRASVAAQETEVGEGLRPADPISSPAIQEPTDAI